MVVRKDEPIIGSDEHEYKCLICDSQFVHFNRSEPKCPKCGSRGAQAVALAKDFEDDDDAFRPE